jgi:hypothetical protein
MTRPSFRLRRISLEFCRDCARALSVFCGSLSNVCKLSDNPPVVTFTYIDSGAVTLDGFGTHLRAYRALLRALPRFEFIYTAPTNRLFHAAESKFHHLVYGRHGKAKVVSLLEYFRVRKAWDTKEPVPSADVILLKEAQLHYVGATAQRLKSCMKNGGTGSFETTM